MTALVRISEAELARIRDRHPHVEQQPLDIDHTPEDECRSITS